mgnify:CR=1 FL=1
MNILLLGENGILSSRIKKYFQEIKDHKINSISLRKKENLKIILLNIEKYINNNDYDLVINAIGPNYKQCELDKDSAEIFYKILPTRFIEYCNIKHIRYLQFSSIHSVNSNLGNCSINSPKDAVPKTLYGQYHNNLEKIFLSDLNFEKYASVVRLSNSIGPAKTNIFSENHWMSICNKLSYDLFSKKEITIKDPNLYKSFIPISLILENLRKIIIYEDPKPIYQYVINFKLKLNCLLQLLSKSFFLYPNEKRKIYALLKEDFMQFVVKENWFTDINDCNIDKYYFHFIYELENTFNTLFEIL